MSKMKYKSYPIFLNFSSKKFQKTGAISSMKLKQTVRKIEQFEKSKFLKRRLYYKRLLRQIKRTGKNI